MHLLAAMTYAGWRPGFGDDDFLGWVITLTYFLIVGLCAWAWRAEVRLSRREGTHERPWFWAALASLLLLLGINKQLDLQCWIEAAGARWVGGHGLGLHRAAVKTFSLLTLGLTGAACLLGLVRYLHSLWRRYLLALVGLLYLGCFVVLRASHSVPILSEINRAYYDEAHLVLELGSILMIGAAAARAIGREGRRVVNEDAAPILRLHPSTAMEEQRLAA